MKTRKGSERQMAQFCVTPHRESVSASVVKTRYCLVSASDGTISNALVISFSERPGARENAVLGCKTVLVTVSAW